MFTYQRTIRMQDTDATGVLYFANQLQIALEAFEAYLAEQGFSIGEMVAQGNFLLPIVHTEADFFAPVYLSDQLTIELEIEHIGTTSFTVDTKFFKGDACVGTASIVHVALSQEDSTSIPIPPILINNLNLNCN